MVFCLHVCYLYSSCTMLLTCTFVPAELALKARREIADYIQIGKEERARIRVEHIIREDLMVEAMEIIEMFCDLLLARFGLLEKMKWVKSVSLTELWCIDCLSLHIDHHHPFPNFHNEPKSNIFKLCSFPTLPLCFIPMKSLRCSTVLGCIVLHKHSSA